jgi:hypothetical protein
MNYVSKVRFRDKERKQSSFCFYVKFYVVVKLFQSFLFMAVVCKACGLLKLMIFCIVISLPCVVKSISLCSNKLCFILAFQAKLWFALFVSLETITIALCWIACCYVALEIVIGGFYWTSYRCVRLEVSFMLLCELGNYYRKFVLSFVLLHELGNEFHLATWTWKLLQEVCIELCIEPCIVMWTWRQLQVLCVELCIASIMLL